MKLKPVSGTGPITALPEWEEDNAYAYLPIMYAPESDGGFGPAVQEPGTIYLNLPLGESEAADPMFSISFEGLVLDYIQAEEHGEGGPVSAGEAPKMKALASELRRLADCLDTRADNVA